MHKLPIVSVVFDNGGWDAVQTATLGVYPGQYAAEARRDDGAVPLASLEPMPDFGLYAEASGGLAVRVTRREDLSEALRQAIQATHDGRQAMVHVIGKG
jgi:acetolactate synthase-1/2/3 large subunit